MWRCSSEGSVSKTTYCEREVVADYVLGMTARGVADRHGISHTTVCRVLDRNGIDRKPSGRRKILDGRTRQQRHYATQRRDPKKWAVYIRRNFLSQLSSRYGIDRATYQKMEEDANGRCNICNREAKLHVDHCHQTGKVRGLLCRDCNLLLGYSKNSVETLTAASAYLADLEVSGRSG